MLEMRQQRMGDEARARGIDMAAPCGLWYAHAYALALKNITGVEIEKMLPTPNINLEPVLN